MPQTAVDDAGVLGGDAPIAPGTDAPIAPGTDAGVPSPPSCGSTALETPPSGGVTYYFSDCQAGAEAGCVPGDDAQIGTSPDAPRRTLDGLDLDALPAGAQLRFARGGAWDGLWLRIHNANATPTSPIVFAAYSPPWGGTARPWIRTSDAPGGVEIGGWTADVAAPHGGYWIEGLHLDGGGVRSWGVWIRDGARAVVVRDCEIDRYEIGIHISGESPAATGVTLRGLHIHHNNGMGILGHGDDVTIEDNLIEANNFSGSGFNHGIYLGSGGHRLRARNNVLSRNSVVDGTCTGGNFTMHGTWDDAVLENNLIVQDRSGGGCYGFSITPAYDVAESFRHFVVRGNTIVNLGNCAVCAGSAPGIVIENNVVVSDRTEFSAAIQIPGIEPGPGDVADEGAVIRNNTFYWSSAVNTPAISLRTAGDGVVVTSNLVEFAAGGDAACLEYDAASVPATVDHNLCHGGGWSRELATLDAARAVGFDLGGLDVAPALAVVPTSENGWDVSLSPSSPAIDAGDPALSAATDRDCTTRVTPDIGADER